MTETLQDKIDTLMKLNTSVDPFVVGEALNKAIQELREEILKSGLDAMIDPVGYVLALIGEKK